MDIYVQSCGVSQDNDYRWLKIEKERQTPKIPQIINRPIPGTSVRVTDMIESKTPSIVIARSYGELLLLVTGLEARKERADFIGRQVRNSVAWVCLKPSDEDERRMRSLAVRALRGTLKEQIDQAVERGGEYGFKVSFERINNLATPENVGNFDTETPIRIGKNSPVFRESLALELEQHCLPQKDGLLVVVTGIKTKYALAKAGVWRGLSTRVEEEKWLQVKEPTKKVTTEKKTLLIVAIAAVALTLILLLII